MFFWAFFQINVFSVCLHAEAVEFLEILEDVLRYLWLKNKVAKPRIWSFSVIQLYTLHILTIHFCGGSIMFEPYPDADRATELEIFEMAHFQPKPVPVEMSSALFSNMIFKHDMSPRC